MNPTKAPIENSQLDLFRSQLANDQSVQGWVENPYWQYFRKLMKWLTDIFCFLFGLKILAFKNMKYQYG